MMLFLFLDCLNYVPTAKVFYQELKKRNSLNIQVCDPGIFSIDELKKRIQDAELIILDNSLLMAMKINPINSIDFYVSNRKPRSFYVDILGIIIASRKPLFLFAPSSDLNAVNFGLERDHYLSLLKRCEGIFWPYFKCPVLAGTIPEKYNSILPSLKMRDIDLINIWNEITGTVKINIDLPHCLSTDEMIVKSKSKKWDIIVPGAGYATRKIALETAVKSGMRVAPFNKYRKWLVAAPYYLYKNLLPKQKRASWHQKNSFSVYRYLISHSSVTFACGSELKYFVRKFLEVSAFRSVMLAYPSDNFRDYGFIDSVHYMYSLPEETGEKAKYLLANKSISEKMIEKAWQMVFDKHSAPVRVEQVLQCLISYKQGKLKGACYNNGSFEIF